MPISGGIAWGAVQENSVAPGTMGAVFAVSSTISAALAAARTVYVAHRDHLTALGQRRYGVLGRLRVDEEFQRELSTLLAHSPPHESDEALSDRIVEQVFRHRIEGETLTPRDEATLKSGLTRLLGTIRAPSNARRLLRALRSTVSDSPTRAAILLTPVIGGIGLAALNHMAPMMLESAWIQTVFSSAENLAALVTSAAGEPAVVLTYRARARAAAMREEMRNRLGR
jgi:hypothetical protein